MNKWRQLPAIEIVSQKTAVMLYSTSGGLVCHYVSVEADVSEQQLQRLKCMLSLSFPSQNTVGG